MTPAVYLAGLARLGLLALGVGLTVRNLHRHKLAQLHGAIGALATSITALAFLLGLAQLLGVVGLLSYWPLTISSWIVALVSRFAWGAPPRPTSTEVVEQRPQRGRWLGAFALAVVVAVWSMGIARSYQVGVVDVDSMRYHLPIAANFAQHHQLTDLYYLELDHLATVAPSNSELLNSVTMSITGNDVLVPLTGAIWVALALLAAWCLGRRWGNAHGAVAAVAIVLISPVSGPGSAKNDLAVVALLLAAIALFAHRRSAPQATAMAAVAGGLAVSTKLTALAPVVGLVVIAVLAYRREPRRLAVPAALLVTTGSFWYLRNLAATGSFVPAADIQLGPLALSKSPDPVLQRFGFTIADHFTDAAFWQDVVPHGLHLALGWAWIALLALVATGVAIGLRRDSDHWVAATTALVIGVTYLVTPYSAGGTFDNPVLFAPDVRFALPFVALGLVLFVTGPRSERGCTAARWLVLAALLGTLYSHDGVFRAVPRYFGALGIVVFLAAFAGLLLLHRHPVSRSFLIGVAAATIVLVALAGFGVQRHYVRARYADGVHGFQPRLDQWAHSIVSARIATSGLTFTYPLYGRDLTNHVEYLGREQSDGGFTSYPSCATFLDAIATGRFDYVVIGPYKSGLETAPEQAWALADGHLDAIVVDGPITVFRVNGDVSETSCTSALPTLEALPPEP